VPHGCGQWHRKSVWLNGVPYGRLCLGDMVLENVARNPRWINQNATLPDTAELRPLAKAAARAQKIELGRRMRAPFEEQEEEAAQARVQHRQEAKAYAAMAQAQEAEEATGAVSAFFFRKPLSPKVITAISLTMTHLAGLAIFMLVYTHAQPTLFVEYVHWPVVHFGIASGTVLLAFGVFLSISHRRTILPFWNAK
jgi:hypothetical protein